MGVAILARELSIKSNRGDAEEMFVAGMLHDLALLLAAQSEPPMATTLLSQADEDPDESFDGFEQKLFGFTHAQLGERLAKSWRFPEHLQAAIRWHHDPLGAPETYRATCNLLFIADTLCCEAAVGLPLTCNAQEISDDQLEAANVSRDVATGLCERLPLLLRLYLS
jgi:HD-like signal output (HDOD) protein